MRDCVTHHYACDCREDKFKQIEVKNEELGRKISQLEAKIKASEEEIVYCYKPQLSEQEVKIYQLEAKVKKLEKCVMAISDSDYWSIRMKLNEPLEIMQKVKESTDQCLKEIGEMK